MEKIGHVKNPLTVISIFAGVAEISGTAILPFIDKSNQLIYIWFLILFPFSLVGLFFYTLNKNHKVLYAPSDYRNEDNFVMHFKAQTIQEKRDRLINEIEEVKDEQLGNSDDGINAAKSSDDRIDSSNEKPCTDSSHKDEVVLSDDVRTEPLNIFRSDFRLRSGALSKYVVAQNLAVQKIASETGLEFQLDMKMMLPNGRQIEFDALWRKGFDIKIIEVKYSSRGLISWDSISIFLERIKAIAQEGFNITAYYVVVSDNGMQGHNRRRIETAFDLDDEVIHLRDFKYKELLNDLIEIKS